MKIDFADAFVYPIRKRKAFQLKDFFPYFGGILGLLLGFSVVSAVEIVYYFLAAPVVNLRKKWKGTVNPAFSQNDANKNRKNYLIIFFKEMIGGSTIHGINYVASQRNLLEKLV